MRGGNVARVGELLGKGADVNARMKPLLEQWNGKTVVDGRTALMLAMRSGHDEVCEALLEAKADAALKDQFGKTAVMMALEHGHTEMRSLKTIVSAATEQQAVAKDDWGQSVLSYAAVAGAADVVEAILKNHPDIDDREDEDTPPDDICPLSLSAKHGQAKTTEAILTVRRSRSSTMSRRDSASQEPDRIFAALVAACRSGHWIEPLVAESPDLDRLDGNGRTLLQHALQFGQHHIARKLLDAGASPQVKTTETPLLLTALEHEADNTTIRALVLKGVRLAEYRTLLSPSRAGPRMFASLHVCLSHHVCIPACAHANVHVHAHAHVHVCPAADDRRPQL